MTSEVDENQVCKQMASELYLASQESMHKDMERKVQRNYDNYQHCFNVAMVEFLEINWKFIRIGLNRFL